MSATTVTPPTVGQMRQTMPSELRQRSTLSALSVLAPTWLLYMLGLLAIIYSPWWLMPLPAMLTSFVIGALFVISHDAAHDAFTPRQWINSIVARVCFLPAWHSYTGWVHAHNHVHHGWTNLRTKDYVWSPMSKSEYDRLSFVDRALVRLYRSSLGYSFYYMYEVLLKKIFILQPEVRNRKVRWLWVLDDLALVGGIVLQSVAIVELSRWMGITTNPAWLILGTVLLPAFLANYWIGFITYLQHTHPLIPWFDNQEDWSFYMGQIKGTTHTQFSYKINSLIHNVMEHTAHHVDPRIPLYHLPVAQKKLEMAYPGDVVEHKFSFRTLLRTLRICQLYDFENHRWLSFSGEPTSSRTVYLAPAEPVVEENSDEDAQEKSLHSVPPAE